MTPFQSSLITNLIIMTIFIVIKYLYYLEKAKCSHIPMSGTTGQLRFTGFIYSVNFMLLSNDCNELHSVGESQNWVKPPAITKSTFDHPKVCQRRVGHPVTYGNLSYGLSYSCTVQEC